LVEYLLRTELAPAMESVISAPDADLHVPALCDVEVSAALRRGLLRKLLTERRAQQALEDYLDLPLTRHGHQALLGRILSLRTNFSAYDASYVALAERLDAALLTGDEGLARSLRAHTRLTTLP
jgi:predicted nucleic acid-binding protein